MAVRLFIGNLPYSATEADVRAHMAGVADPVSVVLPMDRETGRPRGFAFVDYDDLATATEVIRRLNGNLFLGRTLSVSEARPREDRGPRPMGGGFSGPPRMGPALGGPSRMAPSPGGAPGSRERNFGPPAPPKGKRSGPAKSRGEGGPKGPIKVRGGGRVYDVDEAEADAAAVDFDDIATSRPGEPEKDAAAVDFDDVATSRPAEVDADEGEE